MRAGAGCRDAGPCRPPPRPPRPRPRPVLPGAVWRRKGAACGVCPECRDRNASCAFWAKAGFCESNSLVKRDCCLSCTSRASVPTTRAFASSKLSLLQASKVHRARRGLRGCGVG